MPIKIKPNAEHFVQAVRNNDAPLYIGDLVFAWDADSFTIVVGEYRGFEDAFDSETGRRIKHRPRIFVLSRSDPVEMTFDYCVRYPVDIRPVVVTPKGTGVIEHYSGDDFSKIFVADASGVIDVFNESEVIPFDWESICNVQKN